MTPIFSQSAGLGTYVVATAAWNEGAHIERLIRSVLAQTIRPVLWVIVSDGSTDRTDDIVLQYAKTNSFIQLLRITEDHPRNFAAQAIAINVGFKQLRCIDFDFIGNLDADVSFDSTYFEHLLGKFVDDPQLGLAGGAIWEKANGAFAPRWSNSPTSVAHAVQLFRRECFERFGGYLDLPHGGADTHAIAWCRKDGWHVRSFNDLTVFHHRPPVVAGWAHVALRQGRMDFSLGTHPLFELARLARRVKCKPYMLFALVRLWGFVWSYCCRVKRAVPTDFVRFLRQEEMKRLRLFASGRQEER